MMDGVGIPLARVSETFEGAAPVRQRFLRRGSRWNQLGRTEGAHDGGNGARVRATPFESIGHRAQERVGVTGVGTVDLEIARDVRPRHPERTRCGREVRRPARAVQMEADRRVRWTRLTAVVRREAKFERPGGECFENAGQRKPIRAESPGGLRIRC